MDDASLFADVIFGPDSEGAVDLTWEQASRCTTPRDDGSPCFSADSKQPNWNCTTCGGLGAVFAAPVAIRALFRGQSRWNSQHSSGTHGLGEAQLSTPTDVKPGYTDDRIRDRFTVIDTPDDRVRGRVFYPAAQPVPFVFAGAQRAWRVQLQAADQASRVRRQP